MGLCFRAGAKVNVGRRNRDEGQGRQRSGGASQVTDKYNAFRQKAWLVERHNEILRQGLHRTDTQIMEESLVCSFHTVLGLVTFMHSALESINKHTFVPGVNRTSAQLISPLGR